jgi:hypothetical protein
MGLGRRVVVWRCGVLWVEWLVASEISEWDKEDVGEDDRNTLGEV